MSSEERKVVCVTGASGYIASWLVKLLLHRGYTVKATVRDPDDPHKTQHLLALDGAKERLHLFKADLLADGAFDSALPGCQGVFHTASPCFIESSDPQAELIEPAVKGTLNVLKACAKVASIKRVVITSSIASVLFTGKPLTADVIVDEAWYSDPAICKDTNVLWYPLSKTLAEQAAWKFAKENGIDLVTLHPGIVVGPLLQPSLNFSAEMILDLFNGTNNVSTYRFVHVRDVAYAHIRALETPSASGRYCLVERVAHVSEASKMLRQLYPMSKCKDDIPLEPVYQVSKEKAKTLGVNYTSMEESLRDTIESLKEKGFLSY